MRIRKFTENIDSDISSERINEIVDILKNKATEIENMNNEYEKLLNELTIHKNSSNRGNDQIDDSIFALQVIKNNISDILDKSDTIIKNLISYTDEGRKFLYVENK
jgi:hypothetical protein